MVNLYADLIEKGKRTIDQVPLRWRAKVQEELDRRKAEEAATQTSEA